MKKLIILTLALLPVHAFCAEVDNKAAAAKAIQDFNDQLKPHYPTAKKFIDLHSKKPAERSGTYHADLATAQAQWQTARLTVDRFAFNTAAAGYTPQAVRQNAQALFTAVYDPKQPVKTAQEFLKFFVEMDSV